MKLTPIRTLLCSLLFISSAWAQANPTQNHANNNSSAHTAPAKNQEVNTASGHISQKNTATPSSKTHSPKASPSVKPTAKPSTMSKLTALNSDLPTPPKLNPESTVGVANKTAQNMHVDPATGMLSINIPLITIPQNDGLPLNVTLHYRTDGNPAGDTVSLGNGWDLFSGLMPSIGKKSPFWGHICNYPVVLLPDGSTHMFYPSAKGCTPSASKTLHYSKDHWKGMLQTYNVSGIDNFPFFRGTINSPDGKQYTIDHNLQKVVSAHGGTVLTYGYTRPNASNLPHLYTPSSIKSNHGLTVTFAHGGQSQQYETTSMTLGKSVWTFGYDQFHRLTRITKPDGSFWQMTYNSENHLKTFTTPAGAIYTFAYAKGANNAIYAKMVVTSMSRFAPRVPDLKVKYAYHAPKDFPLQYGVVNHSEITLGGKPFRNISQLHCDRHFHPLPDIKQNKSSSYSTVVSYPNKRVRSVFYDGVVASSIKVNYRCLNALIFHILTLSPASVSLIPTWKKGLPISQKIEDTKGHILQTTTNTWGKRKLTTNGGMTDAPELLTQTMTRGAAHTNTYTYDADGFETSHRETSPQGSRGIAFTWYKNPTLWMFAPQNETLFPVTHGVKGKAVNSTVRQYNGTGELTHESDNGVTTSFTYDAKGNLTSQTNALGNKTTYADYIAGSPQTMTDPKGNVTKQKISPEGLLMQRTDPLGHTTKYTYDKAFRLLSATPPLGLPTTWAYTHYTSPVHTATVTKAHGDQKTTTVYNTLGLPDHTVLYSGTKPVNETWFEYDLYGRQHFVSQPSAYGLATVLGTQTTYDLFNRPLTVTTATPLHTTATVEEAFSTGNTSTTYVSKTPGVVREAIVTADLVHHHHSNDHHFTVNGVNHDPYNVTDPDHYYNYYYRYDFKSLHAASPGYKITTNAPIGGNIHMDIIVNKPN